MTILEKAELQEITADERADPVGEPVAVQFNPTTLKLTLSNQVEGGKSRGRQARQFTGKSSTVLSVELVFDTADEGTTDNPRSVRERTAIVEKYVLPKEGGQEAPPKLRFQWGDFVLDGIVESLDLNFDHFASNGTPLRATVSLSLKEQDAKYQFLRTGPGSNTRAGSSGGGQGGDAGPGSSGAPGDRSATALAGETAPEFAARQGLDPAAWRGLDADLSGGLTLEAGAEVGFRGELSVSAGIGVQQAARAGSRASLEASLGLERSPGTGTKSQAFALAAAGGLQAALQKSTAARTTAAASKAAAAFSDGAASAELSATAAGQSSDSLAPSAATNRPPLAAAGSSPRLPEDAGARPSLSPAADSRAATFGYGIPLRPPLSPLSGQPVHIVVGRSEVSGTDAPPLRRNPATPPWVALPARDAGRSTADQVMQARRPESTCDCDLLPGVD